MWWTVGLGFALGLLPRGRPGRPAVATGALIAAFLGWTALSSAWSDSAENVFVEIDRVALYLGVFVLIVCSTRGRESHRLCDGIALAITGIAVLSLVSRFFPGLISTGNAFRFLAAGRTRLNYPLGYWNGLAVFCALAAPLLLRIALLARRAAVRGLALAPLPAIVAVVYLASSRNGALALCVGAFTFFALTARRWAAATAIVVAASGSAAALVTLVARNTLVNGPLGGDVARHQGHSAALLLALICLATGASWAALSKLGFGRLVPSRRSEHALLAGVVVVLAAGVVALHPVRRFEDFKRLPVGLHQDAHYVQRHLLSSSGNGRWQLWRASYAQFKAEPLKGGGAGSFQSWWFRHRPIAAFVRDAHSLYIEVLGELGIVGFALLVGTLGLGLGTGVARALGRVGGEAVTAAAVTAAFGAFAAAAAVDWMWELTAVGCVGVALLALLVGPGLSGGAEETPHVPRLVRVAVAAAALVLIGGQAILMLSDERLKESQAAARRGDTGAAVTNALDARSIEPWAASPYLQLALLAEEQGRLRQARRWAAGATARDPSDWALWLVSARVETKLGAVEAARRSLQRARELNPKFFEASAG